MQVVVTGGSGKLGRAVIDELIAHGYDVANVDVAPPREQRSSFTRIDLTDFGQMVEAFSRIDRPVRPCRCGRPSRGDPRAWQCGERGDLREQRGRDVQRLRRGASGRHPKRGVGLERDGPRPSVRRAAALPAGRRGRPVAARDHLLAGQGAGRGDGPAVLPMGPGAEDDRPPLLERDGAGRLRAVPGLERRPGDPEVEPVELHRRPGRGAGRPTGARARCPRAWTCSSSRTRTRSCPARTRSSCARSFPDVPVRRPLGEHDTMLSIEKARRVLGYEPVHGWRTA